MPTLGKRRSDVTNDVSVMVAVVATVRAQRRDDLEPTADDGSRGVSRCLRGRRDSPELDVDQSLQAVDFLCQVLWSKR